MAIINGNGSLASTIVIIVLIFPEIAAQVVSPRGSAANNVTEAIRQQDDTIRVDPLDSFKKYRGGFNITNKHYWSSVVFTGVYGYAIGVIWLLCGVICGVLLVTIICCCQGDGGRRTVMICPCNDKGCDLLPIPLAILLMILAMAASGLVLVGSAQFRSQARTSVNIIINTADEASGIIQNATGALKGIQGDLVDADVSGELNSTAQKFDTAAENIVKEASKNRRIINRAFIAVFVITFVTIILNLIAVTSLSVSGVLRFWRALYPLVLLGWLMTVVCWLLFGMHFFLENFSDDTCTALYNFQENPYNNSLSSIIPCDELLSEKPVLSKISSGIYNLVNEMNAAISKFKGKLLLNLPDICNPFSAPPQHLYQPENCSPNSIQIGGIPKLLKHYTCFGDEDETCGIGKFISGSEYEVIQAYTSSVQNLLNVYPGLEDLLGCQLVKDAFSQVLLKHCKPLKKFGRITWLAMVCLAAVMVFLVVLWTIKANNHEHRYHPSNDSVLPILQQQMPNRLINHHH